MIENLITRIRNWFYVGYVTKVIRVLAFSLFCLTLWNTLYIRLMASLTAKLYDPRQRIMRSFLSFLNLFPLSHVHPLFTYNLQLRTAAKPTTLLLFSRHYECRRLMSVYCLQNQVRRSWKGLTLPEVA
jgi:hypothetical protein